MTAIKTLVRLHTWTKKIKTDIISKAKHKQLVQGTVTKWYMQGTNSWKPWLKIGKETKIVHPVNRQLWMKVQWVKNGFNSPFTWHKHTAGLLLKSYPAKDTIR
jgi:hypothetical protein